MPLQQDVVGSKAKLKSSAIQGPPLPFSSLTGETLGGNSSWSVQSTLFLLNNK